MLTPCRIAALVFPDGGPDGLRRLGFADRNTNANANVNPPTHPDGRHGGPSAG